MVAGKQGWKCPVVLLATCCGSKSLKVILIGSDFRACLLKSTFTEASHDRGFKTCQTPATYPECVFCGKMYRWGVVYVECHMDPNISKVTTGKERVVAACAESQSTSRDPNRTRFLAEYRSQYVPRCNVIRSPCLQQQMHRKTGT